MTRRWLKTGAAIGLVASALAMARARGESTLSIELPPSMLVDNPFTAQVVPAVPIAEQSPLTTAPEEVSAPVVTTPLPALSPPSLPLPALAELAPAEVESPPAIAGNNVDAEEPSLYLLPPVEVPSTESAELPAEGTTESPLEPNSDILPVPPAPESEMLNEMEAIWSGDTAPEITPTGDDAASTMPYTPTVAELSQQLLPSVRRAYGLAQRGALFAAQAEFVQVLRRIAQAKDAEQGGDEHSRALAAGLRALDEADDFMPAGVQLEAEMNVGVIASSHRTPVPEGRQLGPPHEAIAIYHQYALEQLGESVAGERAGSMALYGLGKIYNRLANEADGDLREQRKAMTMFRAALVAGPENHLAANEIGVLLSRSGHPTEAAVMFRRAIDLAPTSTNYHNLAIVERKLGQFEQANANAQYAQQLASRDRSAGAVSRGKGVKWVAPQDMARVTPSQQPSMNPMAVNAPAAKTQTARVTAPRGPNGAGQAKTVAEWPQKLVPNAFWR